MPFRGVALRAHEPRFPSPPSSLLIGRVRKKPWCQFGMNSDAPRSALLSSAVFPIHHAAQSSPGRSPILLARGRFFELGKNQNRLATHTETYAGLEGLDEVV